VRQVPYELLRLLRAVSDFPDRHLVFTIDGKVLSKRRLTKRLRKLEKLGWVTQVSEDGWTVTDSGKQKVVELDDWELGVTSVQAWASALASVSEHELREIPDDWLLRNQTVAYVFGEPRRGLPRNGDPYWIARNDVPSGQGVLVEVREFWWGHGGPPLINLRTDGDVPTPGDTLCHRSSHSPIQ
jgi:hypothetical protein